jgi:hypothetical protein
MKIRSILLVGIATLAISFSSLAGGTITNVDLAADGDGAIECVYTPGGTLDFAAIDGIQFWGPGHVVGNIITDSELDPTLTLNNVIDNDTGFAWTGYLVNVYMNKTFTIPTAPVVNSPAGWALASYNAVAVNTGTNFMASILFQGTPAIPDTTGSIDFTYKVAFVGSVQFCEELVPIPEPSMVSLMFGGLVLAARRISRRQPR